MYIKWKRQQSLAAVGLSLLLASHSAHAEVLELEGTIKSVDAEARSVTIVRKTPKGEKVLELEVAKNAGDLAVLKAGDRVSFAYNPDVDIISKIQKGLTDEAAAALEALKGEWVAVEGESGGKKVDSAEMRRQNRRTTIDGSSWSVERVVGGNLGSYKGKFQIDPTANSFDWTGTGPGGSAVEWIGIYQVDGDTLKICYRYKKEGVAERPKEFKGVGEDCQGQHFYACKRIKP